MPFTCCDLNEQPIYQDHDFLVVSVKNTVCCGPVYPQSCLGKVEYYKSKLVINRLFSKS